MNYVTKHMKSQSGFTLVEIGIVVPILILIALGLFQVLFLLTQSSSAEQARIQQSYDRSAAMDQIESDIRLAAQFVPKLDDNVKGQDNYEADSSGTSEWSYAGNGVDANRVLILQEYATSDNPMIAGREPVFLGQGNQCTAPSVATNTVQTYDTIYFVNNQTLYRRRVVDSNPTNDPSKRTCSNQYQQTSCPVGTSSSCPDDEVIANHVTGFDIDYYAAGDSPDPIDAYSASADPTLISGARSVSISITVSQRAGRDDVSSTSSLRVATINQTPVGGN